MRALLVAMLLSVSLGAARPSPILIDVRARIVSAPARITVAVVVEPDPDNRSVCVTLDSGETFRQSCYDHVGVDAPKHQEVVFRDMPEGSYTASGVVLRAGGRQILSRGLEVCVTGREIKPGACFGDV